MKNIHETQDADTKMLLLTQFCNGFYHCEIGQGIAYRTILLSIYGNDYRTGDFSDKLKRILAKRKNETFSSVVLKDAGKEEHNVHLLAYYLFKLKDKLGLFESKDCKEKRVQYIQDNPFENRNDILQDFYTFVTPDRLTDWLIDSCETKEDLEAIKNNDLKKMTENKKLRPISSSDIILYLLSCGVEIAEDNETWKGFFTTNPYDLDCEFPTLTKEGAQKLLLFSGFLIDGPAQDESDDDS